jgi:integrase/recombinase XerD
VKVQRIQVAGAEHFSWVVLDDHYVPIVPIVTFLKFLDDLGRSPHTRRATAHHLKLFWEFLRDEQLLWTDIDVAHLAHEMRNEIDLWSST